MVCNCLYVMQDDDLAVLALHASPTGWHPPEWLTKLGSNPPQPRAAPQTLATPQEVRSGVNTTGIPGNECVESDDSSNGEDDVGEVRTKNLTTAAKVGEASEEETMLPADVREVAFQQLDEALLSSWQKETILKVYMLPNPSCRHPLMLSSLALKDIMLSCDLYKFWSLPRIISFFYCQVLKKQQPKLATGQLQAGMQQSQVQPDKKTTVKKIPSPKQALQTTACRRPAGKSGQASGAGMQWVVNTLEEGGNPVHVRQRKPIPLGEHHICMH